MSHDGTSHSDGESTPNSARTVVDLYFRNVNTTGTTRDIWQVGDALLGEIEDIEVRVDVVEEDLETFEERTERRLSVLEAKVAETEENLALLIFNLESEGFPINFEELLKYRIKYLKL